MPLLPFSLASPDKTRCAFVGCINIYSIIEWLITTGYRSQLIKSFTSYPFQTWTHHSSTAPGQLAGCMTIDCALWWRRSGAPKVDCARYKTLRYSRDIAHLVQWAHMCMFFQTEFTFRTQLKTSPCAQARKWHSPLLLRSQRQTLELYGRFMAPSTTTARRLVAARRGDH